MHVELFELVARGAEVFAGVEFRGLFDEYLADCRSHRQTPVGVDVDFANRRLRGFAELFFGDTDRRFELAAVFVDFVNILLRNRGRTVEDNREAGNALFDFFENVEAERRRNEAAVFVARLSFVGYLEGCEA